MPSVTHLAPFGHFLSSVCSTLSHSKLFNSYLKKPCGRPSSQHALWWGGAGWAVSIVALGILPQTCGMARKPCGAGSLANPDSGLSIPVLPAPRGCQALIPAAVTAHSYSSRRGKGFRPGSPHMLLKCTASWRGKGGLAGRECWNTGNGFPLKRIMKTRGNLVHENTGKLHPNRTASGPKNQTEHMSWERRQECQAVKSSPPPHAGA